MSATTHTKEISLSHQQHLMLDGVSWEFYERVLEEIGDRPIRVTFFHDSIEIMAPLLIHERACCAIQSLVNMLAFERDIEMRPFGSTTFRRKDKRVGHDPDACFYLKNDRRVRGMKQFDHAVHPPPDLVLEIDIIRRCIPRQPIYEALGVPELWRYDGTHLSIHVLSATGSYDVVDSSPTFPFLPIEAFEKFIHRMETEEQGAVLREFQTWATSL